MRILALAVTVTCFGFAFGAVVGAATPTPGVATPTPGVTTPPASTPSVVSTSPELRITYNERAISWNAIAGATSYKLTGSVTAVETGAGGACAPSAGNRIVPINLNETLPASTTSFPLPLVALPAGEHWTINA